MEPLYLLMELSDNPISDAGSATIKIDRTGLPEIDYRGTNPPISPSLGRPIVLLPWVAQNPRLTEWFHAKAAESHNTARGYASALQSYSRRLLSQKYSTVDDWFESVKKFQQSLLKRGYPAPRGFVLSEARSHRLCIMST